MEIKRVIKLYKKHNIQDNDRHTLSQIPSNYRNLIGGFESVWDI